jgi:hypothetical protein
MPIRKKGEGRRVENYRGVARMTTLCTMYAAVLAMKLKIDMEGNDLISHNQTGFRRNMDIMNNVYILNYLINR